MPQEKVHEPDQPTTETAQETPDEKSDTTAAQTFTPITTQAELDRIIGNRLYAERAKYEGYDELKEKASKFDEQEAKLAELQSKVSEYEHKKQLDTWAKEASEATGVPANVLKGDTKEALLEHAELIKSSFKPTSAPVVPGDGNYPLESLVDEERKVVRNLFRKGE